MTSLTPCDDILGDSAEVNSSGTSRLRGVVLRRNTKTEAGRGESRAACEGDHAAVTLSTAAQPFKHSHHTCGKTPRGHFSREFQSKLRRNKLTCCRPTPADFHFLFIGCFRQQMAQQQHIPALAGVFSSFPFYFEKHITIIRRC